MIADHPGQWQHFINRSDNRGLSIMEMKQKYLKEQLMFEQALSFQMQQQAKQAQLAASGGKKKTVTNTNDGCIQFVVDTTEDTFFEFTATSLTSEFTYTIEWGDGQSESGSSGEGGASLNHTYPDSDTEYTVRMCFSDPSIINNLNFPGFD